MTTEQKHKLSRQIVSAIEKTEYYRNAIGKMKRHPKMFHEATGQIRLIGNRNTIWIDFTIEEAITICRKKLKQAEIKLSQLTKKIK
jgi:hypothetical protein